jgi:hypothetical protein
MARPVTEVPYRAGRAPSAIGWHGVYLETPSAWDLAAISGDMTRGHVRIDGPGDMHAWVKWQKVRGTPDVERILERYLKTVVKSSRSRKSPCEINRDVRLPVHGLGTDRKAVFFGWKSDRQAIGLLWHCNKCGRVTVAQLDGPLGKGLDVIGRQILGSLDDHAVDGCHTWALYGLSAEVPADFTLSSHKLLSGYLELQFTRGASRITLDRWGLADVVLKKQSLENWAGARYRNMLKAYDYEIQPAEVRGHPGVAIAGSLRGLREKLRAGVMKLVRLSPATELTQYVWHCEATNRICAVTVFHDEKEFRLGDDVAASFACHT